MAGATSFMASMRPPTRRKGLRRGRKKRERAHTPLPTEGALHQALERPRALIPGGPTRPDVYSSVPGTHDQLARPPFGPSRGCVVTLAHVSRHPAWGLRDKLRDFP